MPYLFGHCSNSFWLPAPPSPSPPPSVKRALWGTFWANHPAKHLLPPAQEKKQSLPQHKRCFTNKEMEHPLWAFLDIGPKAIWFSGLGFFCQERNKCTPHGRDCIEQNCLKTFGCNVTCEGIYADVQWTDGALGVKSYDEPSKRTKNRNGKDMGTMKMLRLISEYKEFKRNAVQNFRFNSTSRSRSFGKMLIK